MMAGKRPKVFYCLFPPSSPGFPQRLENLENENGYGRVMENSWNMKNWPKVMEFCDSVIEIYQFYAQFVLNL